MEISFDNRLEIMFYKYNNTLDWNTCKVPTKWLIEGGGWL
jgi:hypothetical protein